MQGLLGGILLWPTMPEEVSILVDISFVNYSTHVVLAGTGKQAIGTFVLPVAERIGIEINAACCAAIAVLYSIYHHNRSKY